MTKPHIGIAATLALPVVWSNISPPPNTNSQVLSEITTHTHVPHSSSNREEASMDTTNLVEPLESVNDGVRSLAEVKDTTAQLNHIGNMDSQDNAQFGKMDSVLAPAKQDQLTQVDEHTVGKTTTLPYEKNLGNSPGAGCKDWLLSQQMHCCKPNTDRHQNGVVGPAEPGTWTDPGVMKAFGTIRTRGDALTSQTAKNYLSTVIGPAAKQIIAAFCCDPSGNKKWCPMLADGPSWMSAKCIKDENTGCESYGYY